MAEVRGFISVKLNQIKTAIMLDFLNCGKLFIYKDAHRLYKRRNDANDVRAFSV